MRVQVIFPVIVSILILTVISLIPSSYAQAINGIDESLTQPDIPLAPVAADGTWFEFRFSTAGVDATGCTSGTCVPSSGTPTSFAPSPPWTFTCASGGCILTVTDAFLNGDQFTVFDFGGSIGTTSAVAVSGSCGSDPQVCLVSASSSSGVFNLAAGSHSLTIKPLVSPFNSGAAYFKAVPPTPVGGTMIPLDTTALLLAGVQSISMWMIPVVAAGIVIGIFVIKRRK